jgi:hypothetical protein
MLRSLFLYRIGICAKSNVDARVVAEAFMRWL